VFFIIRKSLLMLNKILLRYRGKKVLNYGNELKSFAETHKIKKT